MGISNRVELPRLDRLSQQSARDGRHAKYRVHVRERFEKRVGRRGSLRVDMHGGGARLRPPGEVESVFSRDEEREGEEMEQRSGEREWTRGIRDRGV